MRILVTGGAGYVGSVAVELLQTAGHEVTVMDNLAKGHTGALPSDTPLYSIDLRDAGAVIDAVKSASPDAVMHFGAVTIVPESMSDPGQYYAVNTAGTNNLLMAMVAAGVERFVMSSTAAVYGHPDTPAVKEGDPLRPISPYGASKMMAEQILKDFSVAHGLSYAVFRYFNVAGATELHGEDHHPETHLIPSVIQTALGRRDALTVFGRDYPTPDGTAVRDYVHVIDLVNAHVLALDWQDGQNGIFNLGGGRGASVAEVIAAVERVTGRLVPVVEGPRREGDPPVLVADCSRAASVLQWHPCHSDLSTIVESAWKWFERFPNGYEPNT